MSRTLAVVGATATGKTAVAVAAALRLGGEVISMDSRQVYRGMDIGTAKPALEERKGVPHHGFDLVDPDQRFTAGDFARFARRTIAEIEGRGQTPILAGGTGFYLRSLTHPIFRQPGLDPEPRERLRSLLAGLETERLRAWLLRLDPPMAERLSSWGGRQRLLRALEMPLLTGYPLSWWQRKGEPEAAPLWPLVFVLEAPREELDRRVEQRARCMVEEGLVDEVRRLVANYGADAHGLKAHGYMELVPHLRGEITLEEALAAVVRDTARYQRRQVTWFRNQLGPEALRLDASRPAGELASELARAVSSS
ncbi:MAG: tRNA (adenosine(37)-N6)-dimethylallyltransferase MiaA [Longimicrobiaceae bacterium]